MAYKTVNELFWTDPDLKRVSPKAKLLALYLITNPHSHYSGLYYLPRVVIPIETGLSQADIDDALSELGYPIQISDRVSDRVSETEKNSDRVSTANFIKIDENYSLVWIKSMLRYQIGGKISPKIIKGLANHLSSLPDSFLLTEFSQHYHYLNIPFFCPKAYPIPQTVEVAVEVAAEEEASVSEKEAVEGGVGGKHGAASNGKARKKPPKIELTDEEWLEFIRKSPAYEDLDVDKVIAKCQNHFISHQQRQATRGEITAWLNREQKPFKKNPDDWREAFK